MSIYSKINLLENHFLPKNPIPALFLRPTDGRGLLGPRKEYAPLEKDSRLNAWVDELCQDAPFDWFSELTEGKKVDSQQNQDRFNRLYIPVVKPALWQNQAPLIKAASARRVKEVTLSLSENSPRAYRLYQAAMKSDRVLTSHKAFLGAKMKIDKENLVSSTARNSPVASSTL